MIYAENDINPLILLLFYINTCVHIRAQMWMCPCECRRVFVRVTVCVTIRITSCITVRITTRFTAKITSRNTVYMKKKRTPSTYVPRPPQDISNKAWWSRIRASYARTTSSRGDSSLTWYPSCPLTSSISSPALTVITTSPGLYLWGLIGFCGKCC